MLTELFRLIFRNAAETTPAVQSAPKSAPKWRVVVTSADGSEAECGYEDYDAATAALYDVVVQNMALGNTLLDIQSRRSMFKAYFEDGSQAMLVRVHVCDFDF
jgi:hypothetical protein